MIQIGNLQGKLRITLTFHSPKMSYRKIEMVEFKGFDSCPIVIKRFLKVQLELCDYFRVER